MKSYCTGLDADSHKTLILVLLSLPGFGPAHYWKFREHVSSLDLLSSLPLDYLECLLPAKSKQAFRSVYRQGHDSELWQRAEQQQWQLTDQGITLISHEDLRYPDCLHEIHSAPPLLYVKGAIEILNMPQLAVVGSRHASPGGSDNAFAFAKYLASVGFAITSGLALGIDTRAHQGALAAKGKTIAVLGTGIDVVYPRRNAQLAQQILSGGGAIVSEFPLGTAPHSRNFPRRNRIVSGLSLGVLVVEAALASGSLISARYALEQNREVFAIPGSIHNPLAKGCHGLIRDGATLVETALDIARVLKKPDAIEDPLAVAGVEPTEVLNAVEQKLWQQLGFDASSVDQLVERTQLQPSTVIATLMTLQLKGRIAELDNGCYQRAGV